MYMSKGVRAGGESIT
jgi:hypothetical protein